MLVSREGISFGRSAALRQSEVSVLLEVSSSDQVFAAAGANDRVEPIETQHLPSWNVDPFSTEADALYSHGLRGSDDDREASGRSTDEQKHPASGKSDGEQFCPRNVLARCTGGDVLAGRGDCKGPSSDGRPKRGQAEEGARQRKGEMTNSWDSEPFVKEEEIVAEAIKNFRLTPNLNYPQWCEERGKNSIDDVDGEHEPYCTGREDNWQRSWSAVELNGAKVEPTEKINWKESASGRKQPGGEKDRCVPDDSFRPENNDWLLKV